MSRSEMRRALAHVMKSGPRVCCECRGRLRPALQDEMVVIDRMLREGSWPEDFRGHELVAAKLCAECGHVTVLTHRGTHPAAVGVWCPGFGLHVRVVASPN